jgi:hypothetical protein
MWEAVLSMLLPFELGDQASFAGPRNEALFHEPPSMVYTGPVGAKAMAWIGMLVGSYKGPDGTATTLGSAAPHSLVWSGSKFGDITLDLTANPQRLKAADRDNQGPSYSLSMLIEVVHTGGVSEMGVVSKPVFNAVDQYAKV